MSFEGVLSGSGLKGRSSKNALSLLKLDVEIQTVTKKEDCENNAGNRPNDEAIRLIQLSVVRCLFYLCSPTSGANYRLRIRSEIGSRRLGIHWPELRLTSQN